MKILITAGATWIKIDQVRILTNRFSGRTGLYLGEKLKAKGHKVTLLINPHCSGDYRGLKAITFRYYDEFRDKIYSLLKKNKFDAIIHTAAISDYKLKKSFSGKITSSKKKLNLSLIPTEKIITKIRRLNPKALLIQFKLESKSSGLIDKAYQSLKDNGSDFVVANSISDLNKKYKSYLIDKDKNVIKINSKHGLSRALNKVISR
tara:strand:- start:478 stop:1092 length:615 start_codon:yes stop_codon:yes gene_type:complete